MRSASVFVVEDEALVRMALVDMLESLGHKVVAEAGSIEDASSFAMTAVFDLAVLDINIGGFGIDPVADVIERRKVPYIFVTGYGTPQLPSLFRRKPVLHKPVNPELLARTIETSLKAE